MEKMEETELPVVNDTLSFRIHDFCTNTGEVTEYRPKKYQLCAITFSTSVFPDGVDADSEGWLVVRVRAFVFSNTGKIETFNFKWPGSIIDNEENSRFTQYFEKNLNCYSNGLTNKSVPEGAFSAQAQIFGKRPTVRDLTEVRYLAKSFILNRADEFLSAGTLFLSCDIYFDLSAIKYLAYINDDGVIIDDYKSFMRLIPRAVCCKDGVEAANPKDTFKVFDLSTQVLTLPKFHELRKWFGVYGISPKMAYLGSSLKASIRDIPEHVWIFDTRPHRFLLSLAPNPDNVDQRVRKELK